MSIRILESTKDTFRHTITNAKTMRHWRDWPQKFDPLLMLQTKIELEMRLTNTKGNEDPCSYVAHT